MTTPRIFVKPLRVVFNLFLAPGENLMESICENNKFEQSQRGRTRKVVGAALGHSKQT